MKTNKRWFIVPNRRLVIRHERWFAFILPVLLAFTLLYPVAGFAADCTDNDGDGYGVCPNCNISNGCTSDGNDCNDGLSAVHPGAAELCNGVDDNCVSGIDEGYDVGDACGYGAPCPTLSHKVCSGDGLSTICPHPGVDLDTPDPELAYTLACHDGEDNDCDNLTDEADPDCAAVGGEHCNGMDDNYNGDVDEGFTFEGIDIGDPCTVGVGECQRSGTVICNNTEDDGVCSATAAPGGGENTPGEGNCDDGDDNDCDGLVDLDDPGCQEGEKCDGIDNDGDLLVDEDFTNLPGQGLGQACTVGEGVCETSGIFICSPGKTTTVCDAIPNLGGLEGPTGPTCSDGLDNDCNSLTDENDPKCGSVDLGAWCSLPWLRGSVRDACSGWAWHELKFGALNAGDNAEITAELVAITVDGNIVRSTPVEDNDVGHLVTRTNPTRAPHIWKFFSRELIGRDDYGTAHTAYVPIPMLRVTVKDGLNEAQAYCTNIPYIQVIKPANGNVVSMSEGDDITPVLAVLSAVDPSTIKVKVDGVYILSELGINPETCTSGTPCNGTVTDGPLAGVDVMDLVVNAPAIDVAGSHTLQMKLGNLGCGGHVIVVEGDRVPGSFPRNSLDDRLADAFDCQVDDMKDKGISSGFSVEIDNPTENQVTHEIPTPVQGVVCHGRDITSVKVNGKNLDVEGNVDFTPGDGEDSGDLYEYEIDTTLPQTDLALELTTHQAQIGTFDAGSNRLIAEAIDDLGNRAYDSFFFAVGDVAGPGVSGLSEADILTDIMNDEALNMIQSFARQEIREILDSTETEIENAFVVGLTPSAVQKVFDARCGPMGQEFVNTVRAKLLAKAPKTIYPSGGCSCDPKTDIWASSVTADPNQISCQTTLVDDQINVKVTLPDIHIRFTVSGYCRDGDPVFDICIRKTKVWGYVDADVIELSLDFSVTEGQLNGEAGAEPIFNVGADALIDAHVGHGTYCITGFCDWVLDGLASILNFISFGLIDVDFTPDIDVSKDIEFSKAIGASEPDPIGLGEIKVDEEEIESFGQSMSGSLANVEISPNGLRATLTGKFATFSVDPDIEPTPGAVLSPASLPPIHPGAAKELYLALADDTLNQLFAGLTASGVLKTSCQDTGLTFESLLPDSCEALADEEGRPLVTAVLQGTCHGYKLAPCNLIGTVIPSERPFIEKNACLNARNKLVSLGISNDTPLLLCVKQDNPPNFLIMDDLATPQVETVLRLNDLSVVVVLDRNENGFDGTELASLPKCMDPAASSMTASDCQGFAMCLDLDLLTEMQFATCGVDEKPGLVTGFKEILITDRVSGMACGGVPPAGDDLLAEISADSDPINIDLTENVENYTPPLCAKGLDLGGFAQGLNPVGLKLISIDTPGGQSSPFQDYLGITGDVEP